MPNLRRLLHYLDQYWGHAGMCQETWRCMRSWHSLPDRILHSTSIAGPRPTSWINSSSRWRTDWWKGEEKHPAETVSAWKKTAWFQGLLGSQSIYRGGNLSIQRLEGASSDRYRIKIWQGQWTFQRRMGGNPDSSLTRESEPSIYTWLPVWVYDENQHKRKKGKEGVVALHWHPPVKLWRNDAGA